MVWAKTSWARENIYHRRTHFKLVLHLSTIILEILRAKLNFEVTFSTRKRPSKSLSERRNEETTTQNNEACLSWFHSDSVLLHDMLYNACQPVPASVKLDACQISWDPSLIVQRGNPGGTNPRPPQQGSAFCVCDCFELEITRTAVLQILMLLSLIGYKETASSTLISLVVQRGTKTDPPNQCGSDRETKHTTSSLLLLVQSYGHCTRSTKVPKYRIVFARDTSDRFWLPYKYSNWFRSNFWCPCEKRFCLGKSRHSSEWQENNTSAHQT